ncbi:MAG: SDR family NAD(P)-dependent oxidoreductase, partial [Pseudomonadota bacterium]
MAQEMAPRRLALITGASSGIGQAFARIAAANGFDLCLVARREDRLKAVIGELSAEFGIVGYALPADLCDPSSPETVISALKAQGRSVDVLVNNAGYSLRHVFSKTTLEDQARFIELTVKTPVAFSHLVLPAMLERGWGRIINIASIAAFSSGGKGHTLYPAGKSFLIKFSQSLSAETKPSGIHVTAVAPGFV